MAQNMIDIFKIDYFIEQSVKWSQMLTCKTRENLGRDWKCALSLIRNFLTISLSTSFLLFSGKFIENPD